MTEGNARQASADQPVAIGLVMILSHLARIEHTYDKSKLANSFPPTNLREGTGDPDASLAG